MGSNPSQPVTDFSKNIRTEYHDSIDTFERYLRIQRNLSERTIETYLSCYNTFKGYIGNKAITKRIIEDYLFKSKNRRNNLAMLKSLCSEVVKDFKFPRTTVKPKLLPSKEQLKTFYNELPDKYKVVFLLLVSSGLRVGELINADIDKTNRMIIPQSHNGSTKYAWISFYNIEAEELLKDCIPKITVDGLSHTFKKIADKSGIHIYPHLLRSIFAREMSLKGVQDRYIDAFCGRTPQSVLARHYSDYSPEVLKEIYEKANIKILS